MVQLSKSYDSRTVFGSCITVILDSFDLHEKNGTMSLSDST